MGGNRSMIPELLQPDPQKDLEVRSSENGILTSVNGRSYTGVPLARPRLCAANSLAIPAEPDPFFDDLLALAANVCGAPVAVMLSPEQTRCWVRGEAEATAVELARELAFCVDAAALSDGLMIVPDAATDRIL